MNGWMSTAIENPSGNVERVAISSPIKLLGFHRKFWRVYESHKSSDD
jgi:hypothetical protein